MNKIVFLYDVALNKFVVDYKNNNDFLATMNALEEASRRFLWFFKKNFESKGGFIGYSLHFSEGKYGLSLNFEGVSTEFCAPWVNDLGKLIERHWDFKDPLYISCDTLIEEFRDAI